MRNIRRGIMVAIGGMGVYLFIGVAYVLPVWTAESPVVITEIGAYEKSDIEWIEIENVSSVVVDMTGWKFWEAETNHRLKAEDMVLAPGEIAIIAQNDLALRQAYPEINVKIFDSSWGSLREGGEDIGLRDYEGALVESFVYLEATDAALERKDATRADYTAANWRVHPNGNSIGERNIWSDESEVAPPLHLLPAQHRDTPSTAPPTAPPTSPVYVDGIKITALLPNPVGRDADGEYIELTNTTDGSVSLLDWTLTDNSERDFTIFPVIIDPKETLRIFRSDSKLALNNSGGDAVILRSPDGVIRDSVVYTTSVREGEILSFVYKETESDLIDPIVVDSVVVPETVIFGELAVFDASDVAVPGQTTLRWIINGYEFPEDRVIFQFLQPGTFEAELLIEGAVTSSWGYTVLVEEPIDMLRQRVRISAIMPDPVGPDSEEFIELHNPGDRVIDISGFTLDDIEGGSKPYHIPEGTTLAAGEYHTFERHETKIALNNNEDIVRLLDRDGRLIQSLAYEDAKEGIVIGQNVAGETEWWSAGMSGVTAASLEILGDAVYDDTVLDVPLDELRQYEKGTELVTRGIVAALPGVFGSQYFYIVDQDSGLQVYMYRKDFPVFAVGDRIEVRGEISQSYGETRLKVTDRTAIKQLDHPGAPDPSTLDIESIGEEREGALVTVRGEVTEVKGVHFYVDDLTEEVKVYLKRGTEIKAPAQVGMSVAVTGIVSERNGEYQILPRSSDDIVVSEESMEDAHLLTSGPSMTLWRQHTDLIIVTVLFFVGLLFVRKKKPSSV